METGFPASRLPDPPPTESAPPGGTNRIPQHEIRNTPAAIHWNCRERVFLRNTFVPGQKAGKNGGDDWREETALEQLTRIFRKRTSAAMPPGSASRVRTSWPVRIQAPCGKIGLIEPGTTLCNTLGKFQIIFARIRVETIQIRLVFPIYPITGISMANSCKSECVETAFVRNETHILSEQYEYVVRKISTQYVKKYHHEKNGDDGPVFHGTPGLFFCRRPYQHRLGLHSRGIE